MHPRIHETQGDWLFTLHVEGYPTTKGSPMAFLTNRKALADPKVRPRINFIEGRRKASNVGHKAWAKAIAKEAKREAARTGLSKPLDGPLIFCGRFYVPRPKSRKKDVYCVTRPDYDKLMRTVWDELQRAGVIKQDARFVRIGEPNGKYYECEGYPPGVWLGIRSAEIFEYEDE